MLIVVKIGGNIAVDIASSGLVQDLKNVLPENKVVLVHGGGDEVTEIASKLGKEQKFVVSPEGFRSRYTDKETVEIFAMVIVGKINKQIVSILQSRGVPAVGLSGVDGGLIKADRKKRIIIVDEQGRKRVIDGGYTGKITEVNVHLINFLMENGYVPVIAPLAIGEEFEFLNVDADRTAAYIAGALKADRLLLLTDVEGLILDGKVVPKISLSEAERMLPKIGPGMITKVYAAVEAVKMGVQEALISYGLGKLPISSTLKHECGTVIARE
ncbi:MAG: [LysW]-aminoadipate/[LysW]-glutamate kinase [Nitrososphaerota archaeon]|nr:[LysW]-aminoadipate/[LysW]-glutamate kinase [Candidatus Bathyarchaeota archaeon]MDW8022329.1 [LysW]-aminoadipate/[LysW]-glutamate kinase [Nitrososphaerota archaeon]